MLLSFLIPYREDTEQRARIFSWAYTRLSLLFPDAQIITADAPDSDGMFNRGRSINQAAQDANGDTFAIVDADTVFMPRAFNSALAGIANRGKWAIPYTDYYNLTEGFTQQVIDQEEDKDLLPNPIYEHLFPSPATPEPAVSGLVLVSRKAFETVGGFDNRFKGWGLEDRVFAMELEHVFGPPIRVHSFVYHLWHPAPETQRFEQPYFEDNRALYRETCRLLGVPPIC